MQFFSVKIQLGHCLTMVIISLRFPLPFFISKDKEDQVFNLCFKFGLQFCGKG